MNCRYRILLWLNLKMPLIPCVQPAIWWCQLILLIQLAEISLCFLIRRPSDIGTFFTIDSILIQLLSHWPVIRDRTKSFHSRCNELHHLCICQRKEPSQSTCPASVHQISPLWPIQGKWVCRAHEAAVWSQHPLQKSWPLTLNLHSPCRRIRFRPGCRRRSGTEMWCSPVKSPLSPQLASCS